MNKYSNPQIIKEARESLSRRTTSVKGEEQKVALERYTDSAVLAREIDLVFNMEPTILLHSSEVATDNSYHEITTTLGSLIVSRDNDGHVHVLRNACRHRGAKLIDGSGCSKRLICPYHAWSYSLDGSLIGVPGQRDCFPNISMTDNNLIEIPSVERYGFIWVCPAAVSSDNLETYLDSHLKEMASELAELSFEDLTIYQRTTKKWRGNWKLFAEGGLETYHFAIAHRDTIAPYFHNNLAVIDQLGKHFRVFMPTRVLTTEDSPEQRALSVQECSHTLFFLTPHTAILMQHEHMDVIQMRPLSVNESEISVTTLIPKTADLNDPEQQSHWAKNHAITNNTLDEDWSLGETIQSSIDANAIPYIQYGRNEWALHAFNEVLEGIMANNEQKI